MKKLIVVLLVPFVTSGCVSQVVRGSVGIYEQARADKYQMRCSMAYGTNNDEYRNCIRASVGSDTL
jgi:uncharacterized protein YceK